MDDRILKSISRKTFLRYTLGAIVFVSIPMDLLWSQHKVTALIPSLKGLTPDEYLNIRSMAEVFLADSPAPGFDAGKGMDDYIYNRAEPLEIKDKLKELFAVPSSVFMALLFDLSFTSMRDLPLRDRQRRLNKWKTSSLSIKRTVYHAYRQGTLLMLTSSTEYQDFTGYTEDQYFRPFENAAI